MRSVRAMPGLMVISLCGLSVLAYGFAPGARMGILRALSQSSSRRLADVNEEEQAEYEQRRLAEALVHAANHQEKDGSDAAPASASSTNAYFNAANPKEMVLSQGENTAFDVGLLIAAPIIIGTLGLFFVFPLLIPSLQSSLPPVGTP